MGSETGVDGCWEGEVGGEDVGVVGDCWVREAEDEDFQEVFDLRCLELSLEVEVSGCSSL